MNYGCEDQKTKQKNNNNKLAGSAARFDLLGELNTIFQKTPMIIIKEELFRQDMYSSDQTFSHDLNLSNAQPGGGVGANLHAFVKHIPSMAF
jgi:hypothetical protein